MHLLSTVSLRSRKQYVLLSENCNLRTISYLDDLVVQPSLQRQLSDSFRRLVEMGFDAEESRSALDESGGTFEQVIWGSAYNG